MKRHLIVLVLFIVAFNNTMVSQKTDVVQKTELYQSNYFVFTSNPQLNAHLFLYNKAMGCKFKKTHNDSLAYYSFKDKLKGLTPKDLLVLNSVVLFYKDSLVSKDLLFDSLMRDFSDHLSNLTLAKKSWQITALENIAVFQPYFNKLYWKAIDAANRAWVAASKDQIARLETAVVPELERIYQAKLPYAKVWVDLTCYATWAGAYSYDDTFCHIIFASAYSSNQGDLAAEVVFHEASHFLVDKLNKQIKIAARGKDIRPTINLWHNMIFYTTGFVLERQYAKESKIFFPYYVQMKFEDKFPDFKTTVEACKLYWNPYMNAQAGFDESVNSIVNYMLGKK